MTTIAVALALALPGTAGAATWSAPQRIGSGSGSAGGASIAFTPAGRAYVAWVLTFVGPECVGHCGSPVATDYVTRPAGGAWTAPVRTNDLAGALVGTESEQALVAGSPYDSPYDKFYPYGLDVLRGSGGTLTSLGRPLFSADFQGSFSSAVSVSASGYGVAIWEGKRTGHDAREVLAALRRPLRPFGKPIVLRHLPGAAKTEAATNARGDAVVTWVADDRIYARFAPRGHGFGPRRTVGVAQQKAAYHVFPWGGYHDVALDASGNVTVVWTRGFSREEGSGAAEVWSARARRSGRFGAKRQLDNNPGSYYPTVVAGADGEAIAGWGGAAGARVARITDAGAQVDSVGDGLSESVALDALPDGRAALAFVDYPSPARDSVTGVQVSLRRPGGRSALPRPFRRIRWRAASW